MFEARPLLRAASLIGLLAALSACPPSRTPEAPTRSAVVQKWLDRAKESYATAQVDEADDEIGNALQQAPDDVEIKLWAARIALARLELDKVVEVLAGVDGSEARGLRGRALWYAGHIDAAADELEAMLADPDVRDAWAKDIAALARRGGGRTPFQLSGGNIAVTEMPHVLGTALVVPVEIDGEQALALVATGTPELTLDSATRSQPSWVSLRFGGRIEVKDVPARVQDLSAISRQLNAPIKALLGINLLRHLNATIDFGGGQFVVRRFAPPPPPNAGRTAAYYVKGGGMVVRTAFQVEGNAAPASLLVDTSLDFPVALDEAGWKKAGLELSQLQPVPQDKKLKHGLVPVIRLGSFDVPNVPGVFGAGSSDRISEIEKGLGIDLDGLLGSPLVAELRMTMTDGGRTLWFEYLGAPQEGSEAGREPANGDDAKTPEAKPADRVPPSAQ